MDEDHNSPEELPQAGAQPETPVLENVTAMDREHYFEAAAARGRSWKTRLFTAIGIAAMATGLFLTHAAFFFLGAVAALLASCSHILIAWRDFGKLRRTHPGGIWTKTVRFYEDRIESDSGTGKRSVTSYRAIRREFETRRMYVIDFGQSAPATALRKDGFTTGSVEELRAFLLKKQREAYGGGDSGDGSAP